MYRNYFKIAIRNLSKNTVFSTIHILGLAIGAAACLLIFQYVHFEKSYDQMHELADRIYRVPIRYSEGFGTFEKTAANHPGLGPAMKNDFPDEVESYVRLLHPSNVGGDVELTYVNSAGNKTSFAEDLTYAADSSFFQIFSFAFISGDRKSALNEPGNIVITTSMAKKYFGQEDPVGKVLNLNGDHGRKLTVTAVIEDIPQNSHLNFTALISFNTFFNNISQSNSWIWPEFYTYLLLKPGTDPEILESKFPEFADRYLSEIHKEHNFHTYFSLQPLLDIHLKSDCANEPTAPGNERMVYFLTLLGIFIMVIAWVNYINLSTSKSIERAREVGVRKVVGADRSQLIGQFLTEAILLNGIGILLGLILARAFLPQFAKIVGKDIGDSLISLDLVSQPLFWLTLLGSILLGGLIAGSYPSLVLSAFRPVQVLKGSFHKSRQSVSLRKFLVGFQFIITILLIAATILVTRQLSYMNKEDLGYSKDQILVVKSPTITDSATYFKSHVLTAELEQLAAVQSLSKSSEIPGKLIAFRGDTRKDGQGKDFSKTTYMQSVDHQFINTYHIPLVSGKNFIATDSSQIFEASNNKVLVNQKLAEGYGYLDPDEAIGKHILFKLGPIDHKAEIIGVLKNYHQRSLKEDYDPILYYYPSYPVWNYYALNLQSTDWSQSIEHIESKYKEVFPDKAFEYFFLDEFFDRQYKSEQQFSKVCMLLAGLAIFVGCLGFFGLSALMLVQRTKEIGVRKILGATTTSIMALVTRDFVAMLILANIIAIPLIIYFGHLWLDNFAFNTGLGWQIFALPILFLLSIVFIIVGVQIYRSTFLDPIEALKNE